MAGKSAKAYLLIIAVLGGRFRWLERENWAARGVLDVRQAAAETGVPAGRRWMGGLLGVPRGDGNSRCGVFMVRRWDSWVWTRRVEKGVRWSWHWSLRAGREAAGELRRVRLRGRPMGLMGCRTVEFCCVGYSAPVVWIDEGRMVWVFRIARGAGGMARRERRACRLVPRAAVGLRCRGGGWRASSPWHGGSGCRIDSCRVRFWRRRSAGAEGMPPRQSTNV